MMLAIGLGLVAPALVSAWGGDLAHILSSTHWAPCYFNTTAPSLLDGVATLRGLGTRSIKLALDNPTVNYPWNSPDWPTSSVPSVTALAQHPYYAAALSDAAYDTYSLITYSQSVAASFCDGERYDAAAAAVDEAQFSELAVYLLSTYPNKTFILESWENDWAVRCGGYDPSQPAAPAVVAAYLRWLVARQAGVTSGRVSRCLQILGDAPASVARCSASDGAAAHGLSGSSGAVYHAAEVNIVRSSLVSGTTNLITLLPAVALDMITYSSYDCMATRLFGACLDFIRDHHNRTGASPTPAIGVAEFGVPEETEPQNLLPVITNVVATALSDGSGTPGVRRAAVVFYWELFNNEVNGPGFPDLRCNRETGPSFNASAQNGFWLVRPDMTTNPAWHFFQGLINGTLAPPAPPPPPSWTTLQNSDVEGNSGGTIVNVNGTDASACCLPCYADSQCTAVVYFEFACYLKYGNGTKPISKAGRTLLLLKN